MIDHLKTFYTDFRTTGKFLAVGLIGLTVDNGFLFLSHSYLGLSLVSSKIISTEAAILTNFGVNDIWTFHHGEKPGNKFSRLVKSNGIRLFGLAVSVVVLLILHEKFGVMLLLANLGSIGAGFVFNYTLESFAWDMHER